MPRVQIIPSARPHPYAGQNVRAFVDILNTMREAETLRRSRQLNTSVLNAIIEGQTKGLTPEEIQANVAKAVVSFQPEYSSGLQGFFQRIAAPFVPPSPMRGEVTRHAVETAFGDPYGVKKAQAQYYKARAKPGEQYPEGYKTDLENAISAIERGADPYKVYRRIAGSHPDQSTDLKRILLYTPTSSRLEALRDVLLGGD